MLPAQLPGLHVALGLFPYPPAERRPVANQEEELHKDKERRQKEGLDDIVDKGGGAALKEGVAEDLGCPADHLRAQDDGEGLGTPQGKDVGRVGDCQEERCKDGLQP